MAGRKAALGNGDYLGAEASWDFFFLGIAGETRYLLLWEKGSAQDRKDEMIEKGTNTNEA